MSSFHTMEVDPGRQRKRLASDEDADDAVKMAQLAVPLVPTANPFLTSTGFTTAATWHWPNARIVAISSEGALFTRDNRIFYCTLATNHVFDLTSSIHPILHTLSADALKLVEFDEEGTTLGLVMADGRIVVLRPHLCFASEDVPLGAEVLSPFESVPGDQYRLQLTTSTLRLVLDKYTGRPYASEVAVENQWQNPDAATCLKCHPDRYVLLVPSRLVLDAQFAVVLVFGPDSTGVVNRPFLVRVNHHLDAGEARTPTINRQLFDEGAFALVYLQGIIDLKLTGRKLYILTQTVLFVVFLGDPNPLPVMVRLPLIAASPWVLTLTPAYEKWVSHYLQYVNLVNATVAALADMVEDEVYRTYDDWAAEQSAAAAKLNVDFDAQFSFEPVTKMLFGEMLWCPRPTDRRYRLAVLAILCGLEAQQPVPPLDGVSITVQEFPEDADAREMQLTNSAGEAVVMKIDPEAFDRFLSERLERHPLRCNPLCPWTGLVARDGCIGLLSYFGPSMITLERLDTWRPANPNTVDELTADHVGIAPDGMFATLGRLPQGTHVIQFMQPMNLFTGPLWDISAVLPHRPSDTDRVAERSAELYMRFRNPALIITADRVLVTDFYETIALLQPTGSCRPASNPGHLMETNPDNA